MSRGEGTASSDLDLVVLYAKLDHAWRESFYADGWPVEAFVHDPATLNYFFLDVDAPTGVPSLAQMVLEGVPVPGPSFLSNAVKLRASELLAAGPPELSVEEIRSRRYALTDIVDDLRSPRTRAELVATGASLYQLLADFHLRSRRSWSAKGKAIPIALESTDSTFARRFVEAFDDLLIRENLGPIVSLVSDTMAPLGGFLFDGDRRDAPPSWRRD